jgi:putative ABC transport system permease protein
MAIDPYDFARTAWSRSDMMRYHLNEYMNVMITTPNAVIVSENLRDKLDLKVGDGIIYTVNTTDSVDGVVIAFVDYWPGFEPMQLDRSGQLREQSLIVSSMEFMLSKTAIQPYEVWLKRESGVTDKVIYEDIEEKRINIVDISSATQQITAAKNDPQLQGTNGALTLGFIVSMLICAVGFLIYWIMSVQGRVLQFGIFRAMGMSKGGVIGVLVTEQVLVSGVAVFVGTLIGSLSSLLFVPLFQIVYSSADQPIPFRIISETGDTNKVFLVLAVLLLICFAILARLILRIKIDQAVKLGED